MDLVWPLYRDILSENVLGPRYTCPKMLTGNSTTARPADRACAPLLPTYRRSLCDCQSGYCPIRFFRRVCNPPQAGWCSQSLTWNQRCWRGPHSVMVDPSLTGPSPSGAQASFQLGAVCRFDNSPCGSWYRRCHSVVLYPACGAKQESLGWSGPHRHSHLYERPHV